MIQNLLSLTVLLAALCSWNYSLATDNYQDLSSCEKQDVLWQRIVESEHKELPAYSGLGPLELVKMALQKLKNKTQLNSDMAPEGWKKYLHRRGSVAKVKYISTGDHPYTGVFKGGDCSLLRLSITFDPEKKKAFAPGFALKVLRSGVASSNVSALYTLTGQERNFNFFENPLSNIVPTNKGFPTVLVHKIFKKVTPYPEELLVDHFGSIDQNGKKEVSPLAPRQLFFIPSESVFNRFSSEPHDMRNDLGRIEVGTKVYDVYALSPEFKGFKYQEEYTREKIEDFVLGSEKIGEIVTQSPFISSEFGDTQILFRHEVR